MSEPLKLTRAERYILSNQHRILALLDPDAADEHNRARQALDEGYELDYAPDWVYPDESCLSEDECRVVIGIMSMFQDLKHHYERLGRPAGVQTHELQFSGFDGNTETKYMAYARYVVADGSRFQDLPRGDNFNSHAPTLWRYRPMLAAYQAAVTTPPYGELTEADFMRVIEAGRAASYETR